MEYEANLDDGFSVNYFVMDFDGKDASVDDQLFAMQILAGTPLAIEEGDRG